MSLLAYDPDRVGHLHRSLRLAAEGLRSIACTDPAAADAVRVVRAMAAQVEQTWLPLAARLLTEAPLSRAQRDHRHLGALDQSLVRVMAEGYGWSVQLDPLTDDASVVTAEEARALGAMLGEIDLAGLLADPVQLRWLAQQLQVIGRDARLGAEFVANMRDWTTLTRLLGTTRASLDGAGNPPSAGATTVADLDRVLDGLMAAWRATLPASVLQARTSATIASLLPPLDHPDPYVQALLLRSLRLEPATLAEVTGELLRGWVDTKAGGGSTIDLDQPYGANAADLLLPLLLADPAACAHFMTLVAERPAILFETLDDPEIGHRVALVGTDPANTGSAAAGRALLAVLGYFDVDPYSTAPNTDGYPGDYGPFLADLVAPWLLQFSGANEEWQADDMTKQHALAIALRDDAGLQHLAAAGQRIADGFTRTLAAGPITAATLELAAQVGGLLNILGQLEVEQRADDEADRPRYLWDLSWTVIGAAGSLLPGGPAAGVAVGGTIAGVEELLGPAFDEPDPERVRRDAEYARDVASTAAVAVTLAALFQSWRDSGDLPATAAPPPVPDVDQSCPSDAYRDAVEAWVAQLPGGPAGMMGLGAIAIVDNFSSRGQAEQQCARAAF